MDFREAGVTREAMEKIIEEAFKGKVDLCNEYKIWYISRSTWSIQPLKKGFLDFKYSQRNICNIPGGAGGVGVESQFGWFWLNVIICFLLVLGWGVGEV